MSWNFTILFLTAIDFYGHLRGCIDRIDTDEGADFLKCQWTKPCYPYQSFRIERLSRHLHWLSIPALKNIPLNAFSTECRSRSILLRTNRCKQYLDGTYISWLNESEHCGWPLEHMREKIRAMKRGKRLKNLTTCGCFMFDLFLYPQTSYVHIIPNHITMSSSNAVAAGHTSKKRRSGNVVWMSWQHHQLNSYTLAHSFVTVTLVFRTRIN